MNFDQARKPVLALLSDPNTDPISAVANNPTKNASGTAISVNYSLSRAPILVSIWMMMVLLPSGMR